MLTVTKRHLWRDPRQRLSCLVRSWNHAHLENESFLQINVSGKHSLLHIIAFNNFLIRIITYYTF